MQDPESTVEDLAAAAPNDDASPTSPTGDKTASNLQRVETSVPDATGADDAINKVVDGILHSDIGVVTLLSRLKQSIASVKDFSGFLKKRSGIEDEHAKELRRLCRATHQDIRKADARQGTYARQFEAVTNLHERMADNGLQFALNLHQMQEDLNQLAFEMEKGRKNWKQIGLSAENKAADAEKQMEKAKQKYDSLAEQYDRQKTGESTGRHIGLRGVKSADQREEELKAKVENADKDYQSKVQYAKQQRQELVSATRPQAVKALQDLIFECDAGLTLQMQKFATFNERLLLGNGILVSPLNEPNAPHSKSMREEIMQIDNARDFQSYVRGFGVKVPPRTVNIEYKQHPSLAPKQPPPSMASRLPAEPPSSFPMQPVAPPKDTTPPLQSGPAPVFGGGAVQAPPRSSFSDSPYGRSPEHQPVSPITSQATFHDPHSPNTVGYGSSNDRFVGPGGYGSQNDRFANPSTFSGPTYAQPQSGYGGLPNGPSPYPNNNQQSGQGPSPGSGYGGRAPYPSSPPGQPGYSSGLQPGPPALRPATRDGAGRAPSRPVFGLTLEELFRRDGSPVPLVVYQCIQAVDLFGLDTEGIYRVSGNQVQVQELRTQFNLAAEKVDMRNPESFNHDVNNAALLLKRFFQELPDPLLTREHYDELIEAARISDDIVRRDSLHAIINALPDPNYATLRALVLHLHRIVEHGVANRMTPSTLAVIFAPTLMGPHHGPSMQDAGLQPKVVETILQNSLQIFDED